MRISYHEDDIMRTLYHEDIAWMNRTEDTISWRIIAKVQVQEKMTECMVVMR